MKELAAAGVLWFGRKGSGRMGETARAKQREPPWARAWRENAGDGEWEGRGWEKAISSPSLTPTSQPHSWGQSPGLRKPGEHQGVPCVLGRH